ncbi:methylphosphonate hydroxylase-like [Sycon ciliatum]|uniref:methylphosphonate hydroxylase-like n=1 Tax=Sycon ciliatum TaxID=27933 RepID=UPI0031F63F1F
METEACVAAQWPSFEARCNLDAAKLSFQEHGYICCPNYLSDSELQLLQGEIDRYKNEIVPTLPPKAVFYEDKDRPKDTIIRCEGMHNHDDFFNRLLCSPAFNGLVDCLLGEPCEGNNMQFFSKPPGAKATPPHQDGQYFMHDQGVTLWLALDRATEENGCMFYADASHKQGLLEHVRTDQLGFSQQLKDYGQDLCDTEKCMAVEPACLLGHHPYTVHRANPNASTSHWRPALGLTYWEKSCRNDAELHKRRQVYQEQLMNKLETEGRI